MTMHRRQLLALSASPCISLLASCGGGGDSGGAADGTSPAAGRVVTLQADSKIMGYSYPVSVFVPASYDGDNEAYPTIWANDGDAPFGNGGTRFATLQNVLIARKSKALLIAIGAYGRRQTDYNFPGAYAYHDFITQELIPLIEARFRCDPKRRMLTGLSTGGSFAATALFIEAPARIFFRVFLSVEGAFWQQLGLDNALEQQMADAVGVAPLPVVLILAHGNANGATNAAGVNDMFNRINARHYNGLNLLLTGFATDHVGTDAPALDDAMSRNLL